MIVEYPLGHDDVDWQQLGLKHFYEVRSTGPRTAPRLLNLVWVGAVYSLHRIAQNVAFRRVNSNSRRTFKTPSHWNVRSFS